MLSVSLHLLSTLDLNHRDRSGLWEGPETPQAWLTAMARKRASLSRWEAAVARGDLLDRPVDLSNLFNPNTFLNAVRQQVGFVFRFSFELFKLLSKRSTDSVVLRLESVEFLKLAGS